MTFPDSHLTPDGEDEPDHNPQPHPTHFDGEDRTYIPRDPSGRTGYRNDLCCS